MNIEQERKDFEFWFPDETVNPKAVEKNSDGHYRLMSAASAWRIWQVCAATKAASLPIEAIETGIRSLQDHIDQICDLNDVEKADQLTGGIREGVAHIERYIAELRVLIEGAKPK